MISTFSMKLETVISVLKKKDINNTPDEQIFYSENEFETFD